MKWNSIIFVIGFLLAFAGGYFIFSNFGGSSADKPESENEPVNEEVADTEENVMEVPDEALALSRNGCLSCHSVESLDVQGESIGPDLSIAYSGVKGKHGKELDEFLQDPTSAVMATIIADDPLDDDERDEIIKALKKASENHEQDSEQEAASEE